MSINDDIKALTIIAKYKLKEDWLSAEHDIIYGPVMEGDVSKEDKNTLEELGWFWEDEFDCWATFT